MIDKAMAGHDKIDEFCNLFQKSLEDGSFVKASLGNYQGAEDGLKNLLVKKVVIKSSEKLSVTYRYKTRDIVKNYTPQEGLSLITKNLAFDFFAATLFTTDFDLVLENRKNIITLKQGKPSQQKPLDTAHDRSKTRLIEAKGQAYLQALNITDAKGAVFKNAQDKFRQINKYVEILSTLIKSLPPQDILTVADMGSGKGYLTFALYDYLTNTLQQKSHVTGVEYRPDMVDLCNKVAGQSGFTGLNFVQGTIEEYQAAGINILIALHACDTATDDAIAKGIAAEADLIVVAPCCHKQIRREMEAGATSESLDFLLKHGIFLERQAEMLTDGLRSLILEYHGYTTKIFEFISDAHTPKNVMIVATKSQKSDAQKKAILKKIQDAKSFFGVKTHHLEKILGL